MLKDILLTSWSSVWCIQRPSHLPPLSCRGDRQGSSTDLSPLQAAELARVALQREVMTLQPSLHHADLAQQAEEAVASVSSSHHASG